MADSGWGRSQVYNVPGNVDFRPTSNPDFVVISIYDPGAIPDDRALPGNFRLPGDV